MKWWKLWFVTFLIRLQVVELHREKAAFQRNLWLWLRCSSWFFSGTDFWQSLIRHEGSAPGILGLFPLSLGFALSYLSTWCFLSGLHSWLWINLVLMEKLRQIATATERSGTVLRSRGIEVIESVASTVHCLCVVRLSKLTFNGGLSPKDMIH